MREPVKADFGALVEGAGVRCRYEEISQVDGQIEGLACYAKATVGMALSAAFSENREIQERERFLFQHRYMIVISERVGKAGWFR